MTHLARSALLAAGLIALAGAAQAQKLDPPKIAIQKAEPPRVTQTTTLQPQGFQHDFSRGDQATYWVSPMLQNHDSKVSGVTYKVDGKTQYAKFGFSAVNPAAGSLEVKLSCFDKAGVVVPKYDAVLTLSPYGSAMWSADSIAPQRSTDLLTKDADHVWCSLTAPRPFAAFGTMSLSENGTGHGGTSAINLVAIAR